MDDGSTAPAARPALSRVFGVRTLYEAGFRLALSRFVAALAVLLYLAQATLQLVGLRRSGLRWDFAQFFSAAQALAAGRDPYASFLAGCGGGHWCPGGYIFPPLLAELLRPLTGLDPLGAAVAWLLLSHLFLLGAVLVTWRALRPWLGGAVGPLLLAATLLFLPLYQSLYFIQVGTLLLLLIALGAAAHLRPGTRGGALAGAWLGLAAVLRVTPVLLAPALLVRLPEGAAAEPRRRIRGGPAGGPGAGRRRVLAGALAMAATGLALVAILALLTPFTAEYFSTVLPRIGGGTPILDNQSLPGFFDRAAALWGLRPLPGAAVTLAVLALTLAVALTAAGRARAVAARAPSGLRAIPLRAGVFAAFLAALPLASGITWQHHLITELLVYALLVPLLTSHPSARLARRLVIASYPLMWVDQHLSNPVVIALGLAEPSGWRVAPFLLLTAANLAGMACLWVGALLLLSAAGNRLGDLGAGGGEG